MEQEIKGILEEIVLVSPFYNDYDVTDNCPFCHASREAGHGSLEGFQHDKDCIFLRTMALLVQEDEKETYAPVEGDSVKIIGEVSTKGKHGVVGSEIVTTREREEKYEVVFEGGWHGYYLPEELEVM